MTAERDGREWTSDTSGQRFTQTGKTQGRRFPPQRFSQRSSVVLFVLLLDYLKKKRIQLGTGNEDADLRNASFEVVHTIGGRRRQS